MAEIKITVTAPDISEAINNLAVALTNGNLKTVCKQYGENNTHIDNAGTVNLDTTPNPTNRGSAPQSLAVADTQTNVSYHSETVATPANTVPTVPTSAPQFTLEMLSKAGTALVDEGKMNELMALLAKFGVDALTSLPTEHYGAFATELRNLGGAI